MTRFELPTCASGAKVGLRQLHVRCQEFFPPTFGAATRQKITKMVGTATGGKSLQPPRVHYGCLCTSTNSHDFLLHHSVWISVNAVASYNLGYCYTFGVIVKQDDQIASDWFAKFHRARTAERLNFRQNQKAL